MSKPIRKKLIEVSIPLEAINKASAREKSIRHGHPSTLHLWWARRPLAACRAVLFAQLVDDPSAWPDRFPTDEEQETERKRLHKVIERLRTWEASNDEDILNEARWEIARSVAWGLGEEPPAQSDGPAILSYLQEKAPPVYDPFSGGGSIPLGGPTVGFRCIRLRPEPGGGVDRKGPRRNSTKICWEAACKPGFTGTIGARRNVAWARGTGFGGRRAPLRPMDAR